MRGTGGRLALEQELAEIRKELSDMFPIIRSAFTFYSIATTEEVYAAAAATAAAAAAAAGRDPAAAEAEVADFATAAATDPWKWRRMAGGSRSAAASRSTSPTATARPRSSSVVQASPTTAAAASPLSRQATAGAAAGVPVVAGGGATATATAAAAQQGGVPLPPMEQPPALAALAATVADSVSGMLEMDEQRWLAFCCAAGVTGREPGVRVGDLRLLFWAVNREEERNMTLESKENNDFAFMRWGTCMCWGLGKGRARLPRPLLFTRGPRVAAGSGSGGAPVQEDQDTTSVRAQGTITWPCHLLGPFQCPWDGSGPGKHCPSRHCRRALQGSTSPLSHNASVPWPLPVCSLSAAGLSSWRRWCAWRSGAMWRPAR